MKKYVLQVSIGQKNTAGQKAKEDIAKILNQQGFENVEIKLKKSRLMKFLFSRIEVKNKFKNIKADDIFVMQYPMYSRVTTRVIINECSRRKIKKICIIHDLESLRLYKNNPQKIKEELSGLEKFDCLIAHNEIMANWLRENGITKPIISLELFDYLNDNDISEVSKKDNLIFAGNLEKSKFLEKWNFNKKLTLFGISPSKNYSEKIDYRGVKSPEELPKFLKGSFGLVWDGNSVNTNNGMYGEYTRFNNPHKVSLYLSCGLPIVMWKEAALAKFISKNKLGLVVSNLHELDDKINNLNDNEYEEFVLNARKMATKVRDGFFTKKAVNNAINVITNYK